MQRVTLPEDYIKENMKVEINAKVASGYNQDFMDPDAINLETMDLKHVRQQCNRIYKLALENRLDHFVY